MNPSRKEHLRCESMQTFMRALQVLFLISFGYLNSTLRPPVAPVFPWYFYFLFLHKYVDLFCLIYFNCSLSSTYWNRFIIDFFIFSLFSSTHLWLPLLFYCIPFGVFAHFSITIIFFYGFQNFHPSLFPFVVLPLSLFKIPIIDCLFISFITFL